MLRLMWRSSVAMGVSAAIEEGNTRSGNALIACASLQTKIATKELWLGLRVEVCF